MRELATQQSVSPQTVEQRSAPVAGKITQPERNAGAGAGAAAGPRGSVFSTFRAPAELAEAGTRGAGSQLPFLGQIQQSFGRHDVGHVRAHTGGAAAASAGALNARAFAFGDAVAFGDTPDLHTAAHEAAHVIQQQSGVQLKGGIDGGKRDPYEQHADAVADAVVAGRSAEALLDAVPGGSGGVSGGIGVQRDILNEDLSGNPGEVKNSDGTDATEHRIMTMGDTSNHKQAADAQTVEQQSMVKPLATQQNPLRVNPGQRPANQSLWSEADPAIQYPIGYAPVSGFHGTTASPIVDETPLPTLYVGDGPSVDDIQQGGIGDCYMMAVLAGVVQRDPNRLKSMMTPDGQGGATIRLWRRKDHNRNLLESILPFLGPQYDYAQVSVHVSADLCAWKGGGLRGAGVRAAENPASSAWWANVEPPQLAIHRSDLYQVARWVALFEKAWARLAQDFGQYGGARGGKDPQPGGSGYNALDFGIENYAMSIIYGPEADSDAAAMTMNSTQWSPAASSGVALLSANQGVIDQLCMVGNRPEQSSALDPDAPNVTCASFEGEMAKRLGPALVEAIADPDFAMCDAEHQDAMRKVLSAWTTWSNAQPDSQASSAKSDAYRALVEAAGFAAFAGPVNHTGFEAVQKANPGSVMFERDRVELSVDAQSSLFGISGALAQTPSPQMRVTAVGHAARTFDGPSPQILSQWRADGVASMLRQGINVVDQSGQHRVECKHEVRSVGVGAEGANMDPIWDRVDVNVEAVNGFNPMQALVRSPAIKAAMDLMLDLRWTGDKFGSDQRNVIQSHAYTVMGASFVDRSGGTVPLAATPQGQRSRLFPQVDTDRSSVRVRNPWHGGEPDRAGDHFPGHEGDGDPNGPTSDGIFTMSLEQFIRNYTTISSSTFKRS